jgi:Cupin-like domain
MTKNQSIQRKKGFQPAASTDSDRSQTLVSQSSDFLEAFLNNEQIPLQERAALAFKVLEFDHQNQASSGLPVTQDMTIAQILAASNQPESVANTVANTVAASTMSASSVAVDQLSAQWKQWIVENKLRQVPNHLLVEAMVKDGIDPFVASQAVSSIQADSGFQAESKTTQQLKKLESILKIKQQLRGLTQDLQTIERRAKVTPQEFLETYYATNTPVILTDMMHEWKAMHLWTPDYLKTQYGDCSVEVQTKRSQDSNYEINSAHHKATMSLRDYADMVVAGQETNDYYMVANNGNLDRPEFKSLFQDIEQLPGLLDSNLSAQRVFLWFGPAGTVTPIHHDPMNLVMAQIYGRKRWRLISPNETPFIYNHVGVFSEVDLENPDYEKYPLFKQANVVEAILEPGEIIFVPVGWWHQVKSIDVSISLSFTNFVFPNEYEHSNPDNRY